MKKVLVIFIVVFTASVAFASVKEGKKLFEAKCQLLLLRTVLLVAIHLLL